MNYGDKVKDINPQCAHYGAKGKVVGTTPEKIIFIVSNKGKTFKPGDKLAKTKEQMSKVSSLAINNSARAELEKVGFIAAVGKGIKATGSAIGRAAKATGRAAKKGAKITAGAGAVGAVGYAAGRSKTREDELKRNSGAPYFVHK